MILKNDIKLPKFIGLGIVIFYILAIGILSSLNIQGVFYHPLVSASFSFVCTGLFALVTSYIVLTLYLRSGLTTLLLLGLGLYAIGYSASFASVLIFVRGGVTNSIQTISNVGAFLGSLFHILSVIMAFFNYGMYVKRPNQFFISGLTYSLLTILLSTIAILTIKDYFIMFVSVTGSTPARDLTLFLSAFCFGSAALYFLHQYIQWKSEFLYWYGIAMAMCAVGQTGYSFQEFPSTYIAWMARSQMWIAGIVLLYAILAINWQRVHMLSIEKLLEVIFTDKEKAMNGGFKFSMYEEFQKIKTFKERYKMLPHQAYLLFVEGKINSLKDLLKEEEE
jgi:hypothetical protein